MTTTHPEPTGDQQQDAADEENGEATDVERDSGAESVETESTGAASDEETDHTQATARFSRRPWGSRLTALLVAGALGLTGLGAWFTIETNKLRSSAAATNQALVDTQATAEVKAAVTNALNQIFSYSSDTIEETRKTAERVLAGQAEQGYLRLFGRVSELAPQQRITVTSRVVRSAVIYLDEHTARLLVFLDQAAKRAGQDAAATAAAQLTVTAERRDGRWVITELRPH